MLITIRPCRFSRRLISTDGTVHCRGSVHCISGPCDYREARNWFPVFFLRDGAVFFFCAMVQFHVLTLLPMAPVYQFAHAAGGVLCNCLWLENQEK